MKMRKRRKLVQPPRYYVIIIDMERVAEFNSPWKEIFKSGEVRVKFPKL